MIDMRLGDCMDLMRGLPDKSFDLAIVDPPYGIGEKGLFRAGKIDPNGPFGNLAVSRAKDWDFAPDSAYFSELFRVSKNQIIWGGNYFSLPPSRMPIAWDKVRPNQKNVSEWEYAWTSFDGRARLFSHCGNGGFLLSEARVHPTQKPVELYKWILAEFANPGDKILDTHGGSGSIAIACHDLGFDLTWIEKDPDYYEAATKRYQTHAAQLHLFNPTEKTDPEPLDLDL